MKNLPASAGVLRDVCLIPGSGKSPGGGHGNTLQFYFLERPMDSRAWKTTVFGGHRELDMTEAT